MHVVIDIPEEEYEFCTGRWDTECLDVLTIAVKYGTPLPKGHGRLIDENYLLSILRCEEYETCTWRNCSECNREKCIKERHIVSAPTIIEADKGREVSDADSN